MDHVPEILFIDDNPGDSELVEEAFRQYQVAVRFRKVDNGTKALALLREAVRAGDPLPDLVLLDVNLPMINGHEVLRQIRADPALADIEVVMLSSSERRRDIEQSERQDASYVIKPTNWDEYLVLVRSFEQRLKKRTEASAGDAAAEVPAAAGVLTPPPPLKGLEPEPDER